MAIFWENELCEPKLAYL